MNCDLFETDFQGAEFKNIIFNKCNLSGTQISKVVPKNLDIRNSNIQNMSIEISGLKSLKVDTSQVIYFASTMGLDIKD
jgi:uncharacterized protein YjbI with pentapeptide repeats